MIGDAQASLALLKEFVEAIREKEQKRRKRDADLARLLKDFS
jgi:hypothetical protein